MIKCPYCKEILKVENKDSNTHYTECPECKHSICIEYEDNNVKNIKYKRRDIKYSIWNKKNNSPISFDKELLKQLEDISIIFVCTENDLYGSTLRTRRNTLETILNNLKKKFEKEKETIYISIESEEEILEDGDTF